MRSVRALLWTVLAGCYNPTIHSGTACDDVCPGDLVCVEHRCEPPGFVADASTHDGPSDVAIDAFTIDGPPGDVDGDGHLDNADNCPTKANADQHDEDGDLIGDVCDPCPHIAGNAADADGDGVGDVCDPQPLTPRQKIVFFDPFTSTLPQWNNTNNTGRIGESMRMGGDLTSDANAHLAVATGELRIEAGGTVQTLGAALPHQMSISVRGMNASYYYGEFYDYGAANGDIAISRYDGTSFSSPAITHYAGTLPTGAWNMRIDESVTTQQMTVATKVGGVVQPILTAATTNPALLASNEMSIYVNHVDIRFDYFIVIETTP